MILFPCWMINIKLETGIHVTTLASGIDVVQRINVGPGKIWQKE